MNLHSHDWPKIILDLYMAGVSNSDLARQLNVTRSAVFKWKAKGVEPSCYLGEKLLALHNKHCPVNDSLPITEKTVA